MLSRLRVGSPEDAWQVILRNDVDIVILLWHIPCLRLRSQLHKK